MYFVEIKHYITKAVVKRLGPFRCERKAEKIEKGISINMDHFNYYTNIVRT